MKIGYKSREVSTEEFLPDVFDPPLIFYVKQRVHSVWWDLLDEIEEGVNDIKLAAKILDGVCVGVSDGAERVTVDEFRQSLQEQSPDFADELFSDVAYRLAIKFMADRREALDALKKTSSALNGTAKETSPA